MSGRNTLDFVWGGTMEGQMALKLMDCRSFHLEWAHGMGCLWVRLKGKYILLELGSD